MSSPHANDGPGVAELIERLSHPNRLERVHAAAGLVWLGRQNPGVVDALIPALKDTRAVVRRMATLVLGDLAPLARQAVPALVEALTDPDERLRRGAAVALGLFGSQAMAAVPALRAALGDKDEGVRSFAATALTLIEPGTGKAAA